MNRQLACRRTPRQVIIAREEAAMVVDKVLHLLLRGGVYGLLEFCEEELPKEVGLLQKSNTKLAATQKESTRVNSEGLKAALRKCGVLLNAEEYRTLLLAYCDSVGFVLADDFVGALNPRSRLPEPMAAQLTAALRVAKCEGPPAYMLVTRQSVLENFLPILFSPVDLRGDALPTEDDVEAMNAMLATDYMEAQRCFSSNWYANDCVSLCVVETFVAALLFLNGNGGRAHASRALLGSLTALLMDRLCIIAAGPDPLLTAAAGTTETGAQHLSSSSGPSGVRCERKFEYYRNEDRRDEWLRSRKEREAGAMYLKHTVGYGGHLPEFQYHFGRPFHIIEENLPQLTKPRPPRPPLAADAFGPGVELRHNRMTEHHFKFA